MGRAGVIVNPGLLLLNRLPIPPRDGGRIMVSLLPPRAAWKFAQLERFGLLILLALLFTGALDIVLFPLMGMFLLLVKTLFGI